MNKQFLVISFLLLSLMSFPFLSAQNASIDSDQEGSETMCKLVGQVTAYSGEPIPEAVVLIQETGQSTETDDEGRFEFNALPSGEFHLEVFASGFMNYRSDGFELNQHNRQLEVTLFRKLAEEIVVTATRTPKLYAEVPVKTTVITTQEIQVRINGMEGKYSQILVDNSPIFSSMIGVYGLEQIPAEMLNRIEVVKGGGSVLYGGNAVAGVVNVLTKEPQQNNTALRLHQEANHGEPYTNLGFQNSLVSKNGNTKGFFFANYKRRNPVDLNGDNLSELGQLKSTNFGLNFYNSFTELDGKLKLGFIRITEDRRGGDLFELPPHQANVAEWINSDLVNLSAEWNHYLSENLYYNVSTSHMHAERDSYYGSGKDLDAYGSSKNPVTFLNAQANYQLEGHLLTTGAQFKGERIKDRALGYGRLIDDTYSEFGLFIQDDIKINRGPSLLVGLRMSKHSLIENLIFNPRMSVLVNLLKSLSWRTTFSTGYRAPQIFDEDLHITQVGGEGMIVENAPNLKDEKSYSINTGFDFGSVNGSMMTQCSIEGFYTALTDAFMLDVQEFNTKENVKLFHRINGSSAKVYGISGEFGYRVGTTLSFKSGLTLQRSRLDEPDPDFGSRDFFRTPNSYGYAQLNYTDPKLVDVNLSLEYTGKMKIPHFAGYIVEDRLETGKTFWVVNLRFKKAVSIAEGKKVNLLIGAYNLFDDYQMDLDLGANRDSGYVYGPSRPQSFYTGFEFSF
ncbi:MAG: TonB-dependent receptor [Deltaproteobacteria bacterium]|nr:TonB-dependent receptor [Deltaproteobacteria bacterium]